MMYKSLRWHYLESGKQPKNFARWLARKKDKITQAGGFEIPHKNSSGRISADYIVPDDKLGLFFNKDYVSKVIL